MTTPVTRRQLRLQARWKPSLITWLITFFALGGLVVGLYPFVAGWVSSYNQSLVLENSAAALEDLVPSQEEQLEQARRYNDALIAGVKLEAGGNVPVGAGSGFAQGLRYEEILTADDEGLMARIKIPGIDVDLPVFHGTSEETLLRGAGHLEGSHLPVGGKGTRSIITAHRGLANATMFTNLDKVAVGDSFTLETLGQALVYQVVDIQVIDPNDTASLVADPSRDLVTLITCTPLGINTQRIVVTAERVLPTPEEAIREVGDVPTIPGFPWWILILAAALLAAVVYLWRRGFVDASLRGRALRPETSEDAAQQTNTEN